ncbi:hypothetical protein MMC07_006096 [Pseudocyphellaria aurata]|nr:hypothetical protein [Pseudocyphellaria aurata]
MSARGQRFHIDLSSDDETDTLKGTRSVLAPSPAFGLVGDIKERLPSSTPKPPSQPQLKNSESGFPSHRKRSRPSTFKQSKVNQPSNTQEQIPARPSIPPVQDSGHGKGQGTWDSVDSVAAKKNSLSMSTERRAINEENHQRISQMSTEEIVEARKELLTGLSPSLIERLLKKANIDDGRTGFEAGLDPENLEERAPHQKKPPKQVTFEIPESISPPRPVSVPPRPRPSDPDLPPTTPPSDLLPASSTPAPRQHATSLPSPPPLDPSSPTFLSSLHQTYFPSLPSSPSSLSWLATPPPSESPYSPDLPSLPPSSIRFDFRGHLLPPRLAAQMSTATGLHHHGAAPEAAGYTVPELAHLARSAFAAQRCIAFQTLGRILYRLGRGDFGHEGELAEGLWGLMEDGKVLDLLVEAAGGGEHGNRSCWATATEAVWLWRKGGGRRWGAK